MDNYQAEGYAVIALSKLFEHGIIRVAKGFKEHDAYKMFCSELWYAFDVIAEDEAEKRAARIFAEAEKKAQKK